MDFDDLVGCGCDIDLEFSCFVEGTVEEGEKTLMGNVWSEVGWIFF